GTDRAPRLSRRPRRDSGRGDKARPDAPTRGGAAAVKALAGAAATLLLGASPLPAAGLPITGGNVRNDRGMVELSAFRSAAEWPEHSTSDHDQVLPAHKGAMVFKFDLPPGTYAAAGFHDENGNDKFDQTLIGLPEEGYLFSNNAKPFLSAPSFDKAAVK